MRQHTLEYEIDVQTRHVGREVALKAPHTNLHAFPRILDLIPVLVLGPAERVRERERAACRLAFVFRELGRLVGGVVRLSVTGGRDLPGDNCLLYSLTEYYKTVDGSTPSMVTRPWVSMDSAHLLEAKRTATVYISCI